MHNRPILLVEHSPVRQTSVIDALRCAVSPHDLLNVVTGLALLSGRLETIRRDAAPPDAGFPRLHDVTGSLRALRHTAGLTGVRTRTRDAGQNIGRILRTLRTSRLPTA